VGQHILHGRLPKCNIWQTTFDPRCGLRRGTIPLLQFLTLNKDPPSAEVDDNDLSPEWKPRDAAEQSLDPNQVHFHVAFYRLSQIMRQMMNVLYLSLDSKRGTWEIIRDICESLQEFQVLLPSHLQMATKEVNDTNDSNKLDVLRSQAVFLTLLFNHINVICCRPLFVQAAASSSQDALSRRRWEYCREIAENAANWIAAHIDEGQKCGHLARMLYSVSGLWLYACEVQALRAIVFPSGSAETEEASLVLNKFLTLFTHSSRPSPHNPQMTAVLKECIRVVMHINNQRKAENLEGVSVVAQPHSDSSSRREEAAQNHPNILSEDTLLNQFLEGQGLNLAMDELIWSPEKSMSTVWGWLEDWKEID
jgi:hypothetical protein